VEPPTEQRYKVNRGKGVGRGGNTVEAEKRSTWKHERENKGEEDRIE